MNRIYTQRIRQGLAEQISQTYYGNVVTSKVKEDIIICRTYSSETLENVSEEVFSKTSYEKLTRLLIESDTDFALVTEWFNKDKPELEKFKDDFTEVKDEK
tara:strand:- start:88 stop:390 length:303 start_codon:yes stop_codon:yes gene_type:complete